MVQKLHGMYYSVVSFKTSISVLYSAGSVDSTKLPALLVNNPNETPESASHSSLLSYTLKRIWKTESFIPVWKVAPKRKSATGADDKNEEKVRNVWENNGSY